MSPIISHTLMNAIYIQFYAQFSLYLVVKLWTYWMKSIFNTLLLWLVFRYKIRNYCLLPHRSLLLSICSYSGNEKNNVWHSIFLCVSDKRVFPVQSSAAYVTLIYVCLSRYPSSVIGAIMILIRCFTSLPVHKISRKAINERRKNLLIQKFEFYEVFLSAIINYFVIQFECSRYYSKISLKIGISSHMIQCQRVSMTLQNPISHCTVDFSKKLRGAN